MFSFKGSLAEIEVHKYNHIIGMYTCLFSLVLMMLLVLNSK